ncbi:FtsK/SpoIIIE domain-containing protein [Enterococcus faecium]|uniref:FtsK/SpoIIIE domain-containing protein n=1 Tax=Enterococcus faecium TaxID=1352 RepID=UPI001D0E9F39|nr:FtsK/SpoIIIE domain-containing protein [Enterococcus faecium]
MNIYRLYLFLMALPFLVGVGFFCYLNIYPIVKPMIDSGQFKYEELIVPASEVIGMLTLIFGCLSFIRRTSKVRGKFFVRVLHRQMLARMIVSRNWVDRKVKKTTDGKSREIIKFPKMYYRKNKFTTEITVPTDGKRYHEQMLKIGPLLEQMFFADLIDSTSELGTTKYTLLIGLGTNRISIKDVKVTKTSIQIMKDFTWDFAKMPHMLIGGGTGGGKTFFLFTLILYLAQIGTVYICDPKNADLVSISELPAFKNHAFSGVERIVRCLKDAEKEMLNRFAYMKTHPEYKWGADYTYYDMAPYFVVADEWSALMAEVNDDFRKRLEIMKPLTQIILKGRQAGVFMILATQRPDTEDIDGKLRDQFNLRVSLGKLEATGYTMIFGKGAENKNFFNNDVRGRGYISDGGMPRENYSPLVPKNFDFKEALSKIPNMIEEDYSKLSLTEAEKAQLEKELETQGGI